jgi:hypothetical protein
MDLKRKEKVEEVKNKLVKYIYNHSEKFYSTNFCTITITITRGWYSRPVVAAVHKVPPH